MNEAPTTAPARARVATPAVPSLVPPRADIAGAVAQLTVKKQKAGHWYSDYDPYQTFSTKAKAQAHDRKLRDDGATGGLHHRVPTLYTYTKTKATSKLSHALQRPHTVAHRLALKALQAIRTIADVKDIFDDQVLAPDDVDEVMTEEAPDDGYKGQMEVRVERYKADYRAIYLALNKMLVPPATAPTVAIADGNLRGAKHRLNQLLNLDPYATYGWKSMARVGKKALKGKGENKPTPTFKELLDRPKATSVRNSDALESFIGARQKLFDLHFV
nr:hypothetical protein [Luteibacter rhizovicinus]